jgi:LSD1 subclass zinc finger protein
MTTSSSSSRTFPLCASCGAALASRESRCGACGAPHANPAPRAELIEDARWGRLDARFGCTGCGALSPVNHLELDGAVSCAQCGAEQPFDLRVWSGVLEWAHDVVSLSAVDPAVRDARPESPLGRDNPYSNVGVTVADRSREQPNVVAGHGPLRVRISPGHPLCPRCGRPWTYGAEAPGRMTLGCPRCSLQSTYQLPTEPSGLYPAVAIVVASPYRSDLAHAKTQIGAGGVASVTCSNCGAPLEVKSGETTVVCSHCQAQSLISSKLWFRLGVSEPRVEPMWLLFAGLSQRRRQLENTNIDPLEEELRARALAVVESGQGGSLSSVGVPLLLAVVAIGVIVYFLAVR